MSEVCTTEELPRRVGDRSFAYREMLQEPHERTTEESEFRQTFGQGFRLELRFSRGHARYVSDRFRSRD